MARNAAGVVEGINDITECCICTETYSDPRMLPCIHTFCLKCLEKTGTESQKKPGDKMPCPLCRKEFIIPVDGFLGIQKNFFMDRLVEMAKLSQPAETIRYCDSCETSENTSNAEAPLARMYCIEYEENLCDGCINYHKKQKRLKNHQIVAFGNQTINEKLIKRAASNNCDQHNKHSIEMYCHDCRKAICIKCFAIEHKGHRCSDVEDVAEKFRKQIEAFVEKVKTSYVDGIELRSQVDVEKANFIKQIETAETEIIKRANELKDLVDKNMQLLLAQLVSRKAETLKALQIQRDEIDTHLRILDSFKTYSKEIQDKGTPGDICRAVNGLCSQSSELEEKHKSFTDQPMLSFSVTFEKTNMESLLSERNIIGTFEGTDGTLNVIEKTPVIPPFSTCKFSALFGTSSNEVDNTLSSAYLSAYMTFQITKLEDKVYVLYKADNRIDVYDIHQPFLVLEEFSVKGLKSPCDMAACIASNCLYVSDSDTKCIWKIVPTDRQVTCWLSDIKEPFTLSVSSDGHVIIPRDGQPFFVEIYIYNRDAVLIRSVRLPENIKHPLRVIETPTANLIVLHRCSDLGPFVLSEVTKNGDIVNQTTSGDEGDMLSDNLRLLVVAGDDDFSVLAIDCGSNMAIEFDSDLEELRVIKSDGRIIENDGTVDNIWGSTVNETIDE